MQYFEISFKVKRERPGEERFVSLLRRFEYELVRGGLVLDNNVTEFTRDGCCVCRVIAMDEDAISESNMNFDTKAVLERLVAKCEALPEVIPGERLDHPSCCECAEPSYYLMNDDETSESSPILCGDCRKGIPLYRLVPIAGEREFDGLLQWRRLYRGFAAQFRSNCSSAYAHDMLQSCVSDLCLQGRSVAGKIERACGTMVFYPLFSWKESLPERCPQCGRNWVNRYRDAVPYERFCRECRIVQGKID